MKRFLFRHTVVTGLLAVAVSSCSWLPNGRTSAADIVTIVPDQLTVCVAGPYEPFVIRTPAGEFAGIDPELVRVLASEIGLRVQFVDVPFARLFSSLDQRMCDVAAAGRATTEDLRGSYLFTEGYFHINQALLVRSADAATYGDLDHVKGAVAVQRGTTGAAYAARHLPEEKLRRFERAADMVEALRSGAVDGVVQDRPVNAYLARSGEFRMVSSFDDGAVEEYSLVLTKESTALREALNAALGDAMADGRYDQILQRYLGGLQQR